MIKSLGHELVAEGIENQYDLDICTSLNIDSFQGFYFEKPLLPSQLKEQYLY